MSWGLAFDFAVELGNAFLVCASRLGSGEFIACSAKGTFVFGRGRIRTFVPSVYSAITYCEELDLVFGVTAGIPNLEVFSPMAPKNVFVSIALGQALVQQIHVSRAAGVIVTVGSDIKVWMCDFSVKPGKFKLSARGKMPSSQFCQGMNKIFFDERRERILVPTHTGYYLYNYDGELLMKNLELSVYTFRSVCVEMVGRKVTGPARNHAHVLNVYKQFLASDGSGAVRVWNQCGDIVRSFPPGKRAVVFVGYVSSEFAVAVDSGGEAQVLDVKTGKVALVQNLPSKVDRVYLFKHPSPLLLVLSGSQCYVYQIDTVWKLFYRPVYGVSGIARFPSEQHAARIGVTLDDGSVYFISAKNRYPVGCSASRTSNLPIAFACERDCCDTDVLMVMQDLSVQLFTYTHLEFEYTKTIAHKCLDIVILRGAKKLKWLVALSGTHGEVIFVKYGSWKVIKKIYNGRYQFTHMFWWRGENCLVAINQEKLIVIDLVTLSVVFDTPFEYPSIIAFDEGSILASYSKSKVVRYKLDGPKQLVQVDHVRLHDEVKSISMMFGAHVIVFEHKCLVGNEHVFSCRTFEFPFSLSAGCFLNRHLDLLVGLDCEVMIVKRDQYYPDLSPIYIPQSEMEDDVKPDPLAKDLVKFASKKHKEVVDDEIELDNRPTIEEIVFNIRQKIKEEKKRIFRWKPKPEPPKTPQTPRKRKPVPPPPIPSTSHLTPRPKAQIITNESMRAAKNQTPNDWSDGELFSATFPTSRSAPRLNQRKRRTGRRRKSLQDSGTTDSQISNASSDYVGSEREMSDAAVQHGPEEVQRLQYQVVEHTDDPKPKPHLPFAVYSKSDIPRPKSIPKRNPNATPNPDIEKLFQEHKKVIKNARPDPPVPTTALRSSSDKSYKASAESRHESSKSSQYSAGSGQESSRSYQDSTESCHESYKSYQDSTESRDDSYQESYGSRQTCSSARSSTAEIREPTLPKRARRKAKSKSAKQKASMARLQPNTQQKPVVHEPSFPMTQPPVVRSPPPPEKPKPKLRLVNIPVPEKPVRETKPDPFDQQTSDSEEEQVREEPVHSRPLLITQESLKLYNPMDVPRIHIRFEGQSMPLKVAIKPKQITPARKLQIKRRQILSEC